MKTQNKINKKLFGMILLVFTMLIILSIQANAYGIAPAKSAVNFEPNLEKDFEIFILSKGDLPIYFSIELAGELAQYAEVDQTSLFLDIGETKKPVKVKLKLPNELPPGINTLHVNVIEQSKFSDSTATAKNAMVGQIIVNVPYTGVYVESKLYPEHGEIDKPMLFTISLFGRGTETASCYATINILDAEEKTIDTIVTSTKMVAPGASDKLETYWSNNNKKGLFTARSKVNCGDKETILTEEFYVGNPSVSVMEITAEEFTLGKIIPIKLALQNNWNRPFSDVYAEILVMDNTGELTQQFKSAYETIGPEEIKDVTAYWETKNLNIGEYNLTVITYFDKKGTLQESFIATVGIDSLEVHKATGKVIDSTDVKKTDKLSVIILLGIIILVLNAGALYYFKYSHRSK